MSAPATLPEKRAAPCGSLPFPPPPQSQGGDCAESGVPARGHRRPLRCSIAACRPRLPQTSVAVEG